MCVCLCVLLGVPRMFHMCACAKSAFIDLPCSYLVVMVALHHYGDEEGAMGRGGGCGENV